MYYRLKSFLLVLCLVFQCVSIPQVSYAQNPELAGELEQSSGPRRQLATIIFAGLAGAILGLSTLSFYGRPQDKLSNIAVGFALGVIVGASYTTYKTATDPYEYLSNSQPIDRLQPQMAQQKPTMSFGYKWNF